MSAALTETLLLTIFLRHDQSNDLEAFQARLKAKDWWESACATAANSRTYRQRKTEKEKTA